LIEAVPSSFRDPTSRVYSSEEKILRGFSVEGAKVFRSAHDSGVLGLLVEAGKLVPYRLVPEGTYLDVEPASLVVEADLLPFVSQPCEWSFTMLQDAALLTLDINIELIEQGFLLKDASAFNVTFDGARPIFLDHGSLEMIAETGIWSAYGQFVDHFLSPLFLEAHLGVPFQPRLRGAVGGIPVAEMNRLLRGKARRRKGVMSHIVIRSRLERGSASYAAEDRSRVAGMQLPRESIKKTLVKMRDLVAGLNSPVVGEWSDYADQPPYESEEYLAKIAFVEGAAETVGGGRVIDVGANSGDFSIAAAPWFSSVLAIDVDSGAIDRLYQRLRRDSSTVISPIVLDLMEPTPATGWMNIERSSFLNRSRGELGLWLAVLHHFTITGGVPLSHSLELAARLTKFAVVEFVTPEDPMVRLISATAASEAAAYDQVTFDFELRQRFRIISSAEVKPTRRLHFVESLIW